MKGEEGNSASQDWRRRVAEMKTLFDQGLKSTLSGALLLLKEQVTLPYNAAGYYKICLERPLE